jgi:energy-coupling factor transporter transmembrane protein EcfT
MTKTESYVYIDRSLTEEERMKNLNLNEIKKQRLLEKKLWSILKEILVFLSFLFFMYWVTFSNISQSSFQYNQLFIATFVKQQNYKDTIGLGDVRVSLRLTVYFIFQ